MKAVRFWRLASKLGYSVAQCTLGDCFYNGNGVDKDLREAVKWYRLAAAQGDADAREKLKLLNG